MAQYTFRGQPLPSYIKSVGPLHTISVPLSNGQYADIQAPRPGGFLPGDVITVPDDDRAIRVMNVDQRFTVVA
jgi:hypothetical protein